MKGDDNRAKIYRDDGEAFQRWGSLDEAEQCYLKALACASGSKDHQTLYRMAELLLEKKNLRLALEYYILTINADRDNPLHKQRFLDIGGQMRFEAHNADVEDVLTACLKTPGLDFSNAGSLWLSLLTKIPVIAPLYADARLFEKRFDPAPLLRPYFLEGLKKIIVHERGFEDFIRRLRQWLLMGLPSRHNISQADYLQLAEAVGTYCLHGDYIIRETAAERVRLREIAGQLADPLYAAVYACYAENDMPGKTSSRWHAIPACTLAAGLFFPRRKEKLERTFAGTKPELLVAGCGTGREALIAALYYPKGKITAIDANRENIAYAILKGSEYNADNIAFRQDDIMNLAKIPKPHDIIYSTDILHHLSEPLKAWQVLWDNLKPAGIMKIGLASKTAFRAVEAARGVIQKFKIGNSRESILDFRTRSVELLSPQVLDILCALPDYYNFLTYKNLLFSPHMHYFTLPEIEEALAKLRLAFEGFDLPAPVLQKYAEKYPDDPDMTSLKNWHAFEQEAPDTFRGLYQFWCRKI